MEQNKQVSQATKIRRSKLIKSKKTQARKINGLDLSQITKEQESVSFDDLSIYTQAEVLLDLLATEGYSVGRLTVEQKAKLFLYFRKFNYLVGRIIDLHTKLPFSSISLQKISEIENPILQNYIYSYFNRIFNNHQFKETLYQCIKDFNTFGIGAILLQDDYVFIKDTEVDEYNLESFLKNELTEKEQEFVDKITEDYLASPKSVSYTQKFKVIEKYIHIINEKYKGILKSKSVDIFTILNRKSNNDIDYHIYNYPKSENISQMRATKNTEDLKETLKKIGYTQAMIEANLNGLGNTIEIDSDPFNDIGMFIVALEYESSNDLDNSLLNRIIEPIVNLIISKKRNRDKANQAYKVIRVVTAEDADDNQIADLEEQVQEAADAEEGYAIVTNYAISWEEISLDAREQIDLEPLIEESQSDIATSLGMPESLLGGEDSYGSSFMKVELLSNEYVAFREKLKSFIEEKIFKPIAIKKGFVIRDEWGEPIPVYPKIRFDKLSIARGTEDFELIKELVQDKILPVTSLLTMLGYDVEEVKSQLREQSVSIFDDAVKDLIADAIGEQVEKLQDNEAFLTKLSEALKMNLETENNEDE